jgi:hypothetical protein
MAALQAWRAAMGRGRALADPAGRTALARRVVPQRRFAPAHAAASQPAALGCQPGWAAPLVRAAGALLWSCWGAADDVVGVRSAKLLSRRCDRQRPGDTALAPAASGIVQANGPGLSLRLADHCVSTLLNQRTDRRTNQPMVVSAAVGARPRSAPEMGQLSGRIGCGRVFSGVGSERLKPAARCRIQPRSGPRQPGRGSVCVP